MNNIPEELRIVAEKISNRKPVNLNRVSEYFSDVMKPVAIIGAGITGLTVRVLPRKGGRGG